jgi:hypothetical protein
MSTNLFFNFTNPQDFNEKTSDVLPNAWEQVEKISSFFSKIIKSNGPDTFSPTSVVFNHKKDIVGVFTTRNFEGKDDLYQALCELLFFPVSIQSSLFIVVTDSNVKDPNTQEKLHDALNISFVSYDYCYIYSLPYNVLENNHVNFQYENSTMSSVIKEINKSEMTSSNDMVELFFIFSHVENKGPFTYDEVLSYYDDNDVSYEIVNLDNLHSSVSSKHFLKVN